MLCYVHNASLFFTSAPDKNPLSDAAVAFLESTVFQRTQNTAQSIQIDGQLHIPYPEEDTLEGIDGFSPDTPAIQFLSRGKDEMLRTFARQREEAAKAARKKGSENMMITNFAEPEVDKKLKEVEFV